jgi:hypothetical protein
LRHQRSKRQGCCTLHADIIRERGSRRPHGVGTTVCECRSPVLGRVEREDKKTLTRKYLHLCISRVRLEGAHHSLDSAGSAQAQPGGHARVSQPSDYVASVLLHICVRLVRSKHCHDERGSPWRCVGLSAALWIELEQVAQDPQSVLHQLIPTCVSAFKSHSGTRQNGRNSPRFSCVSMSPRALA